LTTENGTSDVLDHLRAVMPRIAATHIGLGRVASRTKPYRWRWAIVLVERRISFVTPVEKSRRPGGAVVLNFVPRSGLSSPIVLAQYPSGPTREVEPVASKGRWLAVVPIGESTGRLAIQVLATDETGPRAIANLAIHISTAVTSGALPDRTSTPAGATDVDTPEAAARYLFELVNVERRRHGLALLEWDADLAAIATAHSVDMVATGFFGHTSPRTGNLANRMAGSGYRAAVFRENLAKDIDLASAHGSLMASPGHRSNILSTDITRIGIGVAVEQPDGVLRHWVVTEVFAKPLSQIVIPSTYPYSVSQPSTCTRHAKLDKLARWLLDRSSPTGEVDARVEKKFRGRLDDAGIGWQSMQTRFHWFDSLEHAEAAGIVGHKQYSLCGAAADQVFLDDGRTGFLRVSIFVAPIQRIP
jgi:uncharacterized protein YkwD